MCYNDECESNHFITGIFTIFAEIQLVASSSVPPIQQDTGKQKNQQFDVVSMALVPCYENQTVGTSNAPYFRRSVFAVRLLAQVVSALTGDP